MNCLEINTGNSLDVIRPDPGDNLFIGRGESPPQHNVARYWCERAQRAEQALATAAAKETPMWALFLAEQRRANALETARNELVDRLAKAQEKNAVLVANIAEMTKMLFERIADLPAALFTADAPDLPVAPTRPDGTLAPEPKPWSPPKSGGNPWRVGG